MSKLGEKVKELRIAQNMTQQKLAEQAGVGHSLITALESGRRRYVSASDVTGLAKGLAMTEGELWICIPEANRWNRYIGLN